MKNGGTKLNILVLNGSPKGKHSVTLQTTLFLQKKFSEHTFEILNVGQNIKAFQRDFSLRKKSSKMRKC